MSETVPVIICMEKTVLYKQIKRDVFNIWVVNAGAFVIITLDVYRSILSLALKVLCYDKRC